MMRQIAVESPAAIALLKNIVSISAGRVTNRSKPQPPKPAFRGKPYCARWGRHLDNVRAEQADWNTAGLDALMQHIVVRHHAYLRKELPLIGAVTRARETRGRADAITLVPLEKVFRFSSANWKTTYGERKTSSFH